MRPPARHRRAAFFNSEICLFWERSARSARRSSALAAAALLAACGSDDPRLLPGGVVAEPLRASAPAEPGAARFRRVPASESGLDFRNRLRAGVARSGSRGHTPGDRCDELERTQRQHCERQRRDQYQVQQRPGSPHGVVQVKRDDGRK